MSVEYWGIKGYGVCIDDIAKYIDNEKVNKIVRNIFPNETFEEDVFEDDTFYGSPFNNFAEFLLEYDERSILSSEDNGEGVSYLLYCPPYPWLATKNEPKSKIELEDYILSILHKVCDAKDEVLRKHVDYINTWGGS